MSKIVKVIPNKDYTLAITLNNHHQIIYDMESRLKTVRFGELADLERFKAVRVEHDNTLVWGSLCEITIDEIFSMMAR
jgi:hypothetical protein